MSFFNDIDREDDNAIIEKFEPVNLRDDFEYAFKMFSKALDVGSFDTHVNFKDHKSNRFLFDSR
jgi:hypothetical protein